MTTTREALSSQENMQKVAEWMASSFSLFIGLDESTKSTKRSFVELEIGGQLCSTDPDLHLVCPTNCEGSGVPFCRKDA